MRCYLKNNKSTNSSAEAENVDGCNPRMRIRYHPTRTGCQKKQYLYGSLQLLVAQSLLGERKITAQLNLSSFYNKTLGLDGFERLRYTFNVLYADPHYFDGASSFHSHTTIYQLAYIQIISTAYAATARWYTITLPVQYSLLWSLIAVRVREKEKPNQTNLNNYL